MRYDIGALLTQGFRRHKGWPIQWRRATAAPSYDVVIVGGGGHGLATAYYLAAQHGLKKVAVIEKGWIGGGNTGRNTTVVRSNYFYPQSAAFYDLSLNLYKDLSRTLNYNIMYSPRGMWMLAHDRHGVEMLRRSVNAMQMNGIRAEFHHGDEVRRRIPGLNPSPRYGILAGVLQPEGGTARHDAVAWGYARAADAAGVDIVENCAVGKIVTENGRVRGVQTSDGFIASDAVLLATAGHSTALAATAGVKLPITTFALQAFVSEPVKPVLDTVLLSPATGTYLSQSDKGELVIGAGIDLFPSYAQRGSLPWMDRAAAGVKELFPTLSRLRFLRQWAGAVDVVKDSSPILGESGVAGLYLNCGWGTGGFKAIPAGGLLLAHTIATGEAHPLIRPFGLDRFLKGALIDEGAASGISH